VQFRKKPIVIEAVPWRGDNAQELRQFTGGRFETINPLDCGDDDRDTNAQVFDILHDTWVKLRTGDWVLRGIKGEFYPCAADVFEATYEPVDAAELVDLPHGLDAGQVC
jgi:hypothetical protein